MKVIEGGRGEFEGTFTKSMFVIVIKELGNGSVDIQMMASPDMRSFGGKPKDSLPSSHLIGMQTYNYAEELAETLKIRSPLK